MSQSRFKVMSVVALASILNPADALYPVERSPARTSKKAMEKVALVSTMSSLKSRFWLLSRSMLINASVSLQARVSKVRS